jgi:hypothetical protein
MPNDPFTSIAESMTAMHEMFLSLRAAGFTETQALRLVAYLTSAAGDQPNTPPG